MMYGGCGFIVPKGWISVKVFSDMFNFYFIRKRKRIIYANIKDYNTYEKNYKNLKKVDFLNGWITCRNKYNSTFFIFSTNAGFWK